MIHFGAVEQHIAERDDTRLCDGKPASGRDVSSEDWMEIREARVAATLCPDCQDRLHPLDMQPELYGMGRHSTAHLYAVPVLAALDAIRNCSHCRRRTADDCAAWRKARKAVAVLQEQSRWFVRGVDELHHATGGCTATVYEFADGSVAYFAPDAPDFVEAGELKGADLAAVLRILDERGMPGGMAGWFPVSSAYERLQRVHSGSKRYTWIPSAEIQGLYGDLTESDIPDSWRKRHF